MPETTPVSKPAKMPMPEEPALEEVSGNGFLDRAGLLALAGELAEATVEFEHKGKPSRVLVRELTGDERADMITKQAAAYQAGSLELRNFYRDMLLAGIADPSTPEGARLPLLKPADADTLMKIGASKIEQIIDRIRDLSGMTPPSQDRAEGNSGPILSGVSTSG